MDSALSIIVLLAILFTFVHIVLFGIQYFKYLIMRREVKRSNIGSEKYLAARDKFKTWIESGKIYDYRYNDIFFCNTLNNEDKELMEVILMELDPKDYKKLMLYSISLIDEHKKHKN